MSLLIGIRTSTNTLIGDNDESITSPYWTEAAYNIYETYNYKLITWPRGNSLIGDINTDCGLLDSIQWGDYEPVGGISSTVGFIGVTRDQYGSPLGNCIVQLFRTSDDLFIMALTSDSNGNFLLQSWYTPDTHYIVAYKTGAPDVFGTTLNTLVGS